MFVYIHTCWCVCAHVCFSCAHASVCMWRPEVEIMHLLPLLRVCVQCVCVYIFLCVSLSMCVVSVCFYVFLYVV